MSFYDIAVGLVKDTLPGSKDYDSSLYPADDDIIDDYILGSVSPEFLSLEKD